MSVIEIKICEFCSAKYSTTRKFQKYCSGECAKLFYKKKHNRIIKEINCLECGKKFIKNNKKHIFCSSQCNVKHRSKLAPTSKQWQNIIEYVSERDEYMCSLCGKNNEVKLVVHHKVPLVFGGSNDYENLELLCEKCHGYRHEQIQSGGI